MHCSGRPGAPSCCFRSLGRRACSPPTATALQVLSIAERPVPCHRRFSCSRGRQGPYVLPALTLEIIPVASCSLARDPLHAALWLLQTLSVWRRRFPVHGNAVGHDVGDRGSSSEYIHSMRGWAGPPVSHVELAISTDNGILEHGIDSNKMVPYEPCLVCNTRSPF